MTMPTIPTQKIINTYQDNKDPAAILGNPDLVTLYATGIDTRGPEYIIDFASGFFKAERPTTESGMDAYALGENLRTYVDGRVNDYKTSVQATVQKTVSGLERILHK
jgi:hypothetical protein